MQHRFNNFLPAGSHGNLPGPGVLALLKGLIKVLITKTNEIILFRTITLTNLNAQFV